MIINKLLIYKKITIKILPFLGIALLFNQLAKAQLPGAFRRIQGSGSNGNNTNNANGQTKKGDTLAFQHRDDLADSITISYRFLDSLKNDNISAPLGDFDNYYSVPGDYVTLGNNGTAAFPVLFTPILKAGWDAGFHAFDIYKYTLENTRFFKTTRPFTQLTYLLGSGKEQVIKVLQTQNIKPNWNAGFEYRLISSPGFFQSQNSNHNSYRIFSNYQGKKKRYAAYFVLLGNKLNVSENGGLQNDSNLANSDFKKRFAIPVNLGGDVTQSFNVFSTTVNTGNSYSNFNALFRQSYDFGIKDSVIINDSTTEYLFYPKFRFEHTINYSSYNYKFKDILTGENSVTGLPNVVHDSVIFKNWYDTTLNIANGSLNFQLQDKWKMVSNDFAIRQFPETKNPAQFIEAGIRVENFSGSFLNSKFFPALVVLPQYKVLYSFTNKNFYNVVLHGEYRNKTRNKKWDALAKGEFYATGLNAADYSAYITLARYLNPKLGNIEINFQNVNRSPSYIFNGNSSFNLDSSSLTKKENITVISATAQNPHFTLMARNISIANYTYYKNYYQAAQFSGLVNLTQFIASTKNKISRHLSLYSDFIVQQTTGNNPIRVPLFFTRQRLAFEGNFFKNLFLSTGLDVKYNTPYKANNYSPVVGKFFPQDSTTISNLPDVDLFFDFRIKTFTGLIKIENLNTVDVSHGFGFTNNNLAALGYPIPGFIFRIGVQWNFVN
ncbi:MAG: putative porin [Ginsengibacter sp.]